MRDGGRVVCLIERSI